MNLPRRTALAACLCLGLAAPAAAAPHNVVIFVADGLRYESVTPQTAPTLYRVKTTGVDFVNSHAMYPTLTTANASAIATGHYLGDTGDYANVLYTGFPLASKQRSTVPFLEDDGVLQELKSRFGAGYMGPQPLLCAAHAHGFATAIIGKVGPSAIQAIDCLDGTPVVDDFFGRPTYHDGSPTGSFPLPPELVAAIKTATGSDAPPASAVPNNAQQKWFIAAVQKALLPSFKSAAKPFVMLFWSRDPDGSQHGELDNPGSITPGINGPTGKAGIANADSNLAALLDALAQLGLDKTTDVFVTADHGFSTISKGIPDDDGNVGPASHPQGFVAADVATWLGEKLFDPDVAFSELDLSSGEHPARGNGAIGADANSPDAVVAANGGSDFIYVLGADAQAHAKQIFDHLLEAPYVGALFVNDELMKGPGAKVFAGALPLSAIRLAGSATVPQPSIVIGFRSFDAKDCTLGEQLCAVELADTSLGMGQGMHGSFSRADTRNFMAAMGPDFKRGFKDTAPVSNADIAPTLAHVLGLQLTGGGPMTGRVAMEALVGGKPVKISRKVQASLPAANGLKTILDEQIVGPTVYFDAAGFPGRTVGLEPR
jgi:arylsulfatase A-like enzyme